MSHKPHNFYFAYVKNMTHKMNSYVELWSPEKSLTFFPRKVILKMFVSKQGIGTANGVALGVLSVGKNLNVFLLNI